MHSREMVMIDRDVFARQVKDALVNLYDLTHLQNHPLTAIVSPAQSGQLTGERLRETMWDAIDLVRPAPAIPQTRPEWLNYRLLWLRYIQVMSVEEVCGELGLSRRTFYRRHGEALEALASILWEQHMVRGEIAQFDVESRSPDQAGSRAAVQLAQQSPRRPVDLTSTLQTAVQTVSAYAKRRMVTMEVDCACKLSAVYGDAAMFHQLFLNILTAGLGAASSSRLILTVQQHQEEIHCRLRGLGHKAAQDCMAADEVSISHDLLRVYGGRLWLESEPNPALCFAIPCAKPTNLLIVDDDLEAIELYQRYLRDQEGWETRWARSADQVWAHVKALTPDVILLDILMPQEDGWQLLQGLRAVPDTRDIPVIICSVLRQPALAPSLGADAVLQKPITQDRLIATIQKVLSTR